MQKNLIPKNEEERLTKVKELGILDTEQEERFDAITREATKVFEVPISTITILDEKREWYKSCQGLDTREAPRAISFCAHAIEQRNLFVVEDTLKDERFKDNPMVTGKPYIRFYAGVTLLDKEGYHVGVFCIKDTKPRILTVEQIAQLLEYAKRAETELNKTVEK